MANELVGSVTATPTGPVTIGLGQSLDITARFTLNGPSGATLISRAMNWQKTAPGLPLSFDGETSPTEDTDYTKTCSALVLNAVGTYTLRVQVYSIYNTPPPFDQTVNSNDITVHVAGVREIDAELPERTATVGLPSRESEAELPLRSAEVGLPDRTNEAELPNRTATVGLP